MECGDGYEACPQCRPLEGEEEIDSSDLVDEIRDLIFWENGGHQPEWNCYPFEYYRLFAEWRNTEMEIKSHREMELQKTIRDLISRPSL